MKRNLSIPVSVIIPAYNFRDSLEKVIVAINSQTMLPKEIVIIDSSTVNDVEELIYSYKSNIPIIYRRVTRAYPGEARNLGATLASGNWLAFLDSKTVPKDEWLECAFRVVENNSAEVVFSLTQYISKTNFEELLKASTYGNDGIETTPGTLISKDNFKKSGGFIEGVRTADDLEWRQRLKKEGVNCLTLSEITLTYFDMPNSLRQNLKRFFIYQLYTSVVNVQNAIKDVYLSLFLILSAIIIPRWNSIIGWEESPLYIPNVTRAYLLSLITFLLLIVVVNNVYFRRRKPSVFKVSVKISVLIILTLVTINWNGVIAGWEEKALLYVPHITKIYLGLLVLASILYRGIYFPLRHNVTREYLFPIKWVEVGLLGVMLDMAKAPGYLIGAIIFPFKRVKHKDIYPPPLSL